MSGDGKNLITGGYQNFFHVYDREGNEDICIEAAKAPPKRQQSKGGLKLGRKGGGEASQPDINPETIEFGKKVLYV